MATERGGWGLPRGVWVLIGLAVTGYLLFALRGVLTPIFFAFLIAYLLDPLVDRFEARGVPRSLGIVALLALILGAIGLFLLVLLPSLVQEVDQFRRELPGLVNNVRHQVEPWLATRSVVVPHSVDEAVDLVAAALAGGEGAEVPSQAMGVVTAAVDFIVGGTASAVSIATTIILVPVFAFYLLYDFDRITATVRDLVPWRYRPFVVDVAKEVDEVLGHWVRGQLLMMLALAVLYSVAYSLVGIRLAVPIGILAGLISIVPYVGGAAALVLALLMAFAHWTGWGQVVWVVVAYSVIQVVEGFVITPRILGERVGIGSVWVIVALLVGGQLFGFLGVLLAVPAAAVINIFVLRAVETYRGSALYQKGAPDNGDGNPLLAVLDAEGMEDDLETAVEKAVAENLSHPPGVPSLGVGGGVDQLPVVVPAAPPVPSEVAPTEVPEAPRAAGHPSAGASDDREDEQQERAGDDAPDDDPPDDDPPHDDPPHDDPAHDDPPYDDPPDEDR